MKKKVRIPKCPKHLSGEHDFERKLISYESLDIHKFTKYPECACGLINDLPVKRKV